MPTIEQSKKKLEALCKDLGISEGELKSKFFALYWDQPVLCWNGICTSIDECLWIEGREHDTDRYLFLKSLDSISDEDCQRIAGYYIDGYRGDQLLCASDYLRQKGYLIGFLTLDPEDLKNLVWAKTQEG